MEDFDKKLGELEDLTNDLIGKRHVVESHLVDFGYKAVVREEIVTYVDWGNVRKSVKQVEKEAREDERKKTLLELLNELVQTEYEMPYSKSAFDLISDLEKENEKTI